MQTIKVIEYSDRDKFEFEVNSLLSDGYVLSSSSCGFVDDSKYDYCSSYQAVLVCNAMEQNSDSTASPVQQLKADNWRCGTKDCVCNESGVCDCHNYTQPPTTAV